MANKTISIEALSPGMVIVAVTQQNGPVKIRKSGLVTSDDMVRGLAEMGVLEVQIDPEQTVEIAPVQAPKSQTQRLLDNNHHQQDKNLDHSLADQFNRSLFLPSVQAIPSAWRYYAKPAMSAILLCLGGGAIGWSAATYDNWWPSKDEIYVIPVEPIPTPSQSDSQADEADLEAQENTDEETGELAETSQQTPNQQPVDSELAEQSNGEERVLGYVPDQQSESNNQTIAAANVSADLLEKFKQAVAELENEPVSNDSPEADAPTDVPRIDQLASNLLNQLPSMAFSAHMHASERQERWVRVNGQRLIEGDYIDQQVQIVRIEPQYVILNFRGQDFSMGALTDW